MKIFIWSLGVLILSNQIIIHGAEHAIDWKQACRERYYQQNTDNMTKVLRVLHNPHQPVINKKAIIDFLNTITTGVSLDKVLAQINGETKKLADDTTQNVLHFLYWFILAVANFYTDLNHDEIIKKLKFIKLFGVKEDFYSSITNTNISTLLNRINHKKLSQELRRILLQPPKNK